MTHTLRTEKRLRASETFAPLHAGSAVSAERL